jgi:Fic family protein
MFDLINTLKSKIDSYRPLPVETVKSIRDNQLLNWTYHSNAIEGNTLTLMETKVVLEGITVGGKTMREHLEAINHREAILYLEALVQSQEALNEWQIKNLHQLILKGINDDHAGRYRQQNVLISGASHRPPDHVYLIEKMQTLVKQFNTTQALNCHPVERAARLHADFVGIHPFIYGNGRTSRLLINLELMKAGFPTCIIEVKDRLRYYQALDLYHTQNQFEDFLHLIIEKVRDSFDIYFEVLGIQHE